MKMPFLNDSEGASVPSDLPPVVDAHVHVFPSGLFEAIRAWFDENAWQIRYRFTTSEIFDFLLSHGIQHIVALQYAHKPGIARQLNAYMAHKCSEFPGRITGMATVFPGEPDSESILEEAFQMGLAGVKLHAHVQCFDMNSESMNRIYECCRNHQKPIVMHVGREPKSPAYLCDPYALCNAQKLENVLKDFPDLKVCVPHLGFDETAEYLELIEKYDNLWLDTTMVITDYFPFDHPIDLTQYRTDRIMYGSDFPNIPYAWDRELKALKSRDISDKFLEGICFGNAAEFFQFAEPDSTPTKDG